MKRRAEGPIQSLMITVAERRLALVDRRESESRIAVVIAIESGFQPSVHFLPETQGVALGCVNVAPLALSKRPSMA